MGKLGSLAMGTAFVGTTALFGTGIGLEAQDKANRSRIMQSITTHGNDSICYDINLEAQPDKFEVENHRKRVGTTVATILDTIACQSPTALNPEVYAYALGEGKNNTLKGAGVGFTIMGIAEWIAAVMNRRKKERRSR